MWKLFCYLVLSFVSQRYRKPGILESHSQRAEVSGNLWRFCRWLQIIPWWRNWRHNNRIVFHKVWLEKRLFAFLSVLLSWFYCKYCLVSKEKLLHKYFDFVLKFLKKTPEHHIHGGFEERGIKAIKDIQRIRGMESDWNWIVV